MPQLPFGDDFCHPPKIGITIHHITIHHTTIQHITIHHTTIQHITIHHTTCVLYEIVQVHVKIPCCVASSTGASASIPHYNISDNYWNICKKSLYNFQKTDQHQINHTVVISKKTIKTHGQRVALPPFHSRVPHKGGSRGTPLAMWSCVQWHGAQGAREAPQAPKPERCKCGASMPQRFMPPPKNWAHSLKLGRPRYWKPIEPSESQGVPSFTSLAIRFGARSSGIQICVWFEGWSVPRFCTIVIRSIPVILIFR